MLKLFFCDLNHRILRRNKHTETGSHLARAKVHSCHKHLNVEMDPKQLPHPPRGTTRPSHTHTPICTNTRSHAHAPVLEQTHTHTYTLKPATDCIGLCCCPTRLKRNTPKKSSKKVKILNSIWGEVFSLKPLRAGFNFSASKIQLQVNWNPSPDSTEPF